MKTTSSSTFNLSVVDGPDVLFSTQVDPLEVPKVHPHPLVIDAGTSFSIQVDAPHPIGIVRLLLGAEIVTASATATRHLRTEQMPWLENEFGESRIVLERSDPAEEEHFEPLFRLDLLVNARPEVAADYQAMIEDLSTIHEGLAQDVIGKGYFRAGLGTVSAHRLNPRLQMDRLHKAYVQLASAIESIAVQPSTTLARQISVRRYRPGDPLDVPAVVSALKSDESVLGSDRSFRRIGRIAVRRPSLTTDVPEHRHIAEGVRYLARRARSLADQCDRTAELVEMEYHRWGSVAGGESVFEQRDLPRIRALQELSAKAGRLAEDFSTLIRQHEFLRTAPSPRTPFGPTPGFLGRPAYRESYRALLQVRQELGLMLDTDSIRLTYRNLASLYEYWCFLQVVACLRKRLGPSRPRASFTLIDDVYRPELTPGQQFEFTPAHGLAVRATYTPEILPWRTAARRNDRYGAAFTGEPLRPDVLIEAWQEGHPVQVLVLDAKSTDSFSPKKFRDMADYGRQIFEVGTNRHPVRQVFLLHRDRQRSSAINLPRYLEGEHVPDDANILGAVACVPDPMFLRAGLNRVIDLFLIRAIGWQASSPS